MPPPQASDAELEVLKVLWTHGPATVRDVEAHLGRNRRWAYNTVLTLLSRLREKGYVASDKSDAAAHLFRATVSREQLLLHGLCDLADRVCDGTASPLVHALVDGGRLDKSDIALLRKRLDELERKE